MDYGLLFHPQVECATKTDVDLAVKAAHNAFYEGEWGKMNARDRGALLYKLADLMEQVPKKPGSYARD